MKFDRASVVTARCHVCDGTAPMKRVERPSRVVSWVYPDGWTLREKDFPQPAGKRQTVLLPVCPECTTK